MKLHGCQTRTHMWHLFYFNVLEMMEAKLAFVLVVSLKYGNLLGIKTWACLLKLLKHQN